MVRAGFRRSTESDAQRVWDRAWTSLCNHGRRRHETSLSSSERCLVGRDEVATSVDITHRFEEMIPVGGRAQEVIRLIGFRDGDLDLFVAKRRLQALDKLAVEFVGIEAV